MRDTTRTILAALIATALAAAPAAAQGWALGFEGGLNVSDLGGENVEGTEIDSELGFRGGGVLRYDFAPEGLLGVQTGATYSRKGAADDVLDLNLDYLEVPVVLVVNIPTDGAPVQPRLYGGGSFNFELSCEVAPVEGDGEAVDCDEGDVVERKEFDFGLRFGGGLDFSVSDAAAITVDAGYDLGLTNIDDSAGGDLKNRNLFATAGFIFHP